MIHSEKKTWRIKGHVRLKGTMSVHGNKNSALPCIAASLLLQKVGQSMVLSNVPRIRDVLVMADILPAFGITAAWERSGRLRLSRTEPMPKQVAAPREAIALIRGSIILLGPLAGRYSSFKLPKPGGDKIGTRPITAHLSALADLGVRVSDRRGMLEVKRSRSNSDVRKLRVWLTEQSVTATEILLLHSAFLNGKELTLFGAATEPHIVALCRLLVTMGARIQGISSNILTVYWPRTIREPKKAFRLDDDFMEASTLAVAAAVSRSNVDISYHNPADLELTDRYMKWMGVETELDVANRRWRIRGRTSRMRIRPDFTVIKAEPWPRFHTDIMSLFVVLATQCTGTLKCIEYMYDDRFGFVQALNDMGARIRVQGPHVIVVEGGTPLSGNEMLLRPDIRSGAAMLIAALAARGTSVLHDRKGVVARGYEDLPGALMGAGAKIEEIQHLFE